MPPKTVYYLLAGLDAAPDVFDRLLQSVSDWDKRPDPERFTLREMLAHVADWESVFLNRLRQTRDEENAVLVGYDEGQWAIDHDYAHADPVECLQCFRAGRRELIAFLRGLTPEQWTRVGTHTEAGPLTMFEQAALILGHDGYHARQIIQWTT